MPRGSGVVLATNVPRHTCVTNIHTSMQSILSAESMYLRVASHRLPGVPGLDTALKSVAYPLKRGRDYYSLLTCLEPVPHGLGRSRWLACLHRLGAVARRRAARRDGVCRMQRPGRETRCNLPASTG